MAGDSPALRATERALLVLAAIYPLRLLLGALAGTDLHIGLATVAALLVLVALSPRERPPGFPTSLDLAAAGFVALAVVDFLVLAPPGRRTLQALLLATRFEVLFLLCRWIRPGRVFADRLIVLLLVLGVGCAVVGVLDYHLGWGSVLAFLDRAPTRAVYWKLGLPRLYSPLFNPVGTAYLLVLALAAAMHQAASGRRPWLVVAGVLAIWQALPLTLARAPIGLAVLLTLAFAVYERRVGLSFALGSAAAGAAAAGVVVLASGQKIAAEVAGIGTQTADASAQIHWAAVRWGSALILDRPWGYGLGESGWIATRGGGVHPFFDSEYVSVGVQMGLPGLAMFAAMVVFAGLSWLHAARSRDCDLRALGIAGTAIWTTMTVGGLFHATWSQIAAQCFFALLTAALLSERSEAARAVAFSRAAVPRVALAASLVILAMVLAAGGAFGGWLAVWHEARGARSLARVDAPPEVRKRAVVELSEALARSPLSRRSRLGLADAVERAAAELGPREILPLIPIEPAPASVATAVLRRRGHQKLAASVIARTPFPRGAPVPWPDDSVIESLGVLLSLGNRCAEALPFLAASVAGPRTTRGLELHYARCLVDVGDPARAMEIVGRQPPNRQYVKWPRVILGEAHLKLGEYGAAAAYAREITERWPDYYFGWELTARVLEALGRRGDAANALERALALKPTYRWLRARIERLRSGSERG